MAAEESDRETGAWAHVMQAERAVGCPGGAAAVPPTEHVGAIGATYEAAEDISVEKGRAVSPGATPSSLSFTLNVRWYHGLLNRHRHINLPRMYCFSLILDVIFLLPQVRLREISGRQEQQRLRLLQSKAYRKSALRPRPPPLTRASMRQRGLAWRTTTSLRELPS